MKKAWSRRPQGDSRSSPCCGSPTACTPGRTTSGIVRVRYRFENSTPNPLTACLFVLVRPFQVTPPWQSFGKLGGVSRIHDLAWHDGAARVNETMLVRPSSKPAGFAAMSFDEGSIAGYLAKGALPRNAHAHDAFGFARGALRFDLALQARGTHEIVVACTPVEAAGA